MAADNPIGLRETGPPSRSTSPISEDEVDLVPPESAVARNGNNGFSAPLGERRIISAASSVSLPKPPDHDDLEDARRQAEGGYSQAIDWAHYLIESRRPATPVAETLEYEDRVSRWKKQLLQAVHEAEEYLIALRAEDGHLERTQELDVLRGQALARRVLPLRRATLWDPISRALASRDSSVLPSGATAAATLVVAVTSPPSPTAPAPQEAPATAER
jgi:hypothetical protein